MMWLTWRNRLSVIALWAVASSALSTSSASASTPALLSPNFNNLKNIDAVGRVHVNLPDGAQMFHFRLNATVQVASAQSAELRFVTNVLGKTASYTTRIDIGSLRSTTIDGEPPGLSPLSLIYDPAMLGSPPADLSAGLTWHVVVDRPWESGPAGVETVTVQKVDQGVHGVVLLVSGSGSGPNVAEAKHPPEATELGGPRATVPVRFGKTTWRAKLEFRAGLLVTGSLKVVEEQIIEVQNEPLSATTTLTEEQHLTSPI